jgi:TonB-linked SusC/RagA family outer membrane protein
MQTFNPKTGAATNWNSPATAPRAAKDDYNDINIHFYNTLNWQHTFVQKHNINVMLGASYDNFASDTWGTSMYGFLDRTLDAFDAATTWNATNGNTTRDVLESYFGRLNYDYDGKYLLEFAFRSDGSSRFSPDGKYRWGFFPSAFAGWRIDKENFFKSNFINLLKLRASVGSMGNQSVPLYSYQSTVQLGEDYSFHGVLNSGAATLNYVDPTIHWETTTTYNAGADINFWKNRIGVTLDVYNKHTTGILRQVQIPSHVGNLGGPQRNVGAMDNTGLELTLQYRNNIGAFDYSFNGSVSYNKNKISNLNGEMVVNSDGTVLKEGYAVNSFYILQAEGLFQSQEEVDHSATQSVNTKPGYIKFKDVDNNGIINGDDRVLINTSSMMPKVTYGFGINLGYKGVSLNASFQGVAGVKVLPTANLAYPFNNGANATWEWTTDAWTPENPNARLPIVTTSTGSADNFQRSTFWLRDNSYLRMKNIQLGYALPDRWLSKVKISKLSVFVNAQNLLTFAKYKDFDPEAILDRNDLYSYPMLKTYSGGLNVTF